MHAPIISPDCYNLAEKEGDHIQKLTLTGHLASAIHRLEDGLDKTGECWLWTGGVTVKAGKSYGRLSIGSGSNKRIIYVHRLAYRFWVGPIVGGATVTQVCGQTLCCNPEHLYSSANGS